MDFVTANDVNFLGFPFSAVLSLGLCWNPVLYNDGP